MSESVEKTDDMSVSVSIEFLRLSTTPNSLVTTEGALLRAGLLNPIESNPDELGLRAGGTLVYPAPEV
jgi:hypothetical protein